MAAADAMPAMPADRVNLVDENNAGRGFLALFEHVAHARGADTDEHLDEIRTADREERHVGFARDRARQQRFAGTRRSDQQNTLWNATAELLKLLRIAQELDQLLDFVFRFFDAGDVSKRDLIFVAREHSRL